MASTNPTSSQGSPGHDLDPAVVADRELERQGRPMGRSASRSVLIGIAIAIPGIALILIDHGWSIGIAVVLIASIPLVVGAGLLVSGAVSRLAARRKLFAWVVAAA